MTPAPTKEQNNGIPDDVWEAAARVKHDILFCEESEVVGVIAKAILAERERSARLMEDDGAWTFAGDPAAMAIFEDVRELAADAIRSGTFPAPPTGET